MVDGNAAVSAMGQAPGNLNDPLNMHPIAVGSRGGGGSDTKYAALQQQPG
jgi:hypothetical protein